MQLHLWIFPPSWTIALHVAESNTNTGMNTGDIRTNVNDTTNLRDLENLGHIVDS